jgi:hypothetical protein
MKTIFASLNPRATGKMGGSGPPPVFRTNFVILPKLKKLVG